MYFYIVIIDEEKRVSIDKGKRVLISEEEDENEEFLESVS
jgi:hypothetical protein